MCEGVFSGYCLLLGEREGERERDFFLPAGGVGSGGSGSGGTARTVVQRGNLIVVCDVRAGLDCSLWHLARHRAQSRRNPTSRAARIASHA